MRFVHTADINWGMIPDPDKPWGKLRANAVKDSIRKILEVCREEGADCLFVSGDLFHRPPRREELSELNALFASLPSTHVLLISGNRDRIEKNAALKSFQWAANVDWILEEDLGRVYLEDIHTEVYGMSYHKKEYPDLDLGQLLPESLRPKDALLLPAAPAESPPASLGADAGKPDASKTAKAKEDADGAFQRPIRILLLHGGDGRHIPFTKEALSALPYDYIALGGRHKPEEYLQGKAAYAGSPEPLGLSEGGLHGVYVGEIHPLRRCLVSLSFRPISELSYIQLQIAVKPETGSEELCTLLSQEIERRGSQNIYRIRITGKRDPDSRFGLSALGREYRIIEFCDETEPAYDFAALYREHPADLLGFYIRAMHRDEGEMSYVEKRALYYGIDALLRSQDG